MIKKVIGAVKYLVGLLLHSRKFISRPINRFVYPPSPPEIDPEGLARYIMEDSQLLSELENVDEYSDGWELNLAMVVRRYLETNGSMIEEHFNQNGGKNRLKIGLKNSQAVTKIIQEHYKPFYVSAPPKVEIGKYDHL